MSVHHIAMSDSGGSRPLHAAVVEQIAVVVGAVEPVAVAVAGGLVKEKIEEQAVEVVVWVNLQDFLRLPNQEDLRSKARNIWSSRQLEVTVGLEVPKHMRSLPLGPQVVQYKNSLLRTKP